MALDDVSQWLGQERINGDVTWFKTTSSSIAGLMCSGQSNRKQPDVFNFFLCANVSQ